jgi:hypothetical protein
LNGLLALQFEGLAGGLSPQWLLAAALVATSSSGVSVGAGVCEFTAAGAGEFIGVLTLPAVGAVG